ncbi:hypothetical protein SDC9_203058 [bioreactor metagenome]|uniref:Uncharacterized protein n=1 Tax=bioreactor metagenome TaxID=1076179 RepID=A0A645IW18_9ZZZZ
MGHHAVVVRVDLTGGGQRVGQSDQFGNLGAVVEEEGRIDLALDRCWADHRRQFVEQRDVADRPVGMLPFAAGDEAARVRETVCQYVAFVGVQHVMAELAQQGRVGQPREHQFGSQRRPPGVEEHRVTGL